MIRNIVAVVGGFIVWSAVWLAGNAGLRGGMPERFETDGTTRDTLVLGLALVLSVVCSLFGGWVTGRLANRPPFAGTILGVVLLAVGVAVQASVWSLMPVWYHLVFLALLVPMAKAGAGAGGARRMSPA